MKKMKRTPRIIFATCLTATLLCGTCLTAFGAATADLDLSRTGSISLLLYSDEAQSAVTDGALTLYEVADLTLDNGDMAYVKTDAFSGYEGTLDVEEEGLAWALADYVIENDIDGMKTEISEDGSVQFSDLELGLYLVVQTIESDGYYPIESFLVSVPIEQGGVWAYSVEASPKVEVYPVTPGEKTETPPETDITETPPETDTTEIVTPPGTETPDTTTPVPTTTPTTSIGSKLPQTGQLVWPIIVCAVFGGMFFLIGGVMRKKSRAA